MGRHFTAFFGIIIALTVVGLYGFRYFTKSFSPEGDTSLTTKAGLRIKIDYSRPYKKGRKLFGYDKVLVPFGKLWRTGANEATEIELNKDVTIFGEALKAGRYTLFSIPNEITWTIIFNKELNQWGDFNYDQSKDALRVLVPSYVIKNSWDLFTIEAREKEDGAEVRLAWGNTLVTIPLNLN